MRNARVNTPQFIAISMVELNVNLTDEDVKLKCADIVLLSSLKHGGEMKKPELVEKIRERNKDGYVFDDSATESDLTKRSLNIRLTENIQREYLESENGAFRITYEGEEKLTSLIEKVRGRID